MLIFYETTNYLKVLGILISLLGLYFIMSEDEENVKKSDERKKIK